MNLFRRGLKKPSWEQKYKHDLKNIPATAALEYILQQAGATAKWEPYATVITPNQQVREVAIEEEGSENGEADQTSE